VPGTEFGHIGRRTTLSSLTPYSLDFILGLTEQLWSSDPSTLNIKRATDGRRYRRTIAFEPQPDSPLTIRRFFDRVGHFLPPRAVVIAETGVALFSADESLMPEGAKFIGQLEQVGSRVLAINFRGYGQSRGPGQTGPLCAAFHFDVLAAVRYLRKMGARLYRAAAEAWEAARAMPPSRLSQAKLIAWHFSEPVSGTKARGATHVLAPRNRGWPFCRNQAQGSPVRARPIDPAITVELCVEAPGLGERRSGLTSPVRSDH
jgi:hypothetical protein